jgi:hypothetical protein
MVIKTFIRSATLFLKLASELDLDSNTMHILIVRIMIVQQDTSSREKLGRGEKGRERERNLKIERDSLLFGEKVTL